MLNFLFTDVGEHLTVQGKSPSKNVTYFELLELMGKIKLSQKLISLGVPDTKDFSEKE